MPLCAVKNWKPVFAGAETIQNLQAVAAVNLKRILSFALQTDFQIGLFFGRYCIFQLCFVQYNWSDHLPVKCMANTNWKPLEKPAELSERRIITAILDDTFAVDSNLPAERDLAVQLGVTRPTLREALQRMARDGWLEIRQGKPTRVRNYWQEGNLAVLASIAQHEENLPAEFVPWLLSARVLLAPAYTRQAIEKNASQVESLLANFESLADNPQSFANFDWNLHRQLSILGGNPFFTLFINTLQRLYEILGPHYFALPEARQHSRSWYTNLRKCARECNGEDAQRLTEKIMQESLELWLRLSSASGNKANKQH
jgi:GntR family negative regulator for fad regulon and positive regulator of fabA